MSREVTMICQHLVTFLLVMATRHLTTPEVAAVDIAAREILSTSLYVPGEVSASHDDHGGTVVHVKNNNNSNKDFHEIEPGKQTPRHFQEQQKQKRDEREREEKSPSSKDNIRFKNTPGSGGGGDAAGRDSSLVDTVLAALVDYSRNPELWRFVHSVVDELDFSQRVSHPPAPSASRPKPALHLSRPHTHWLGTAADVKSEAKQGDKRSYKWWRDSERPGKGNKSGDSKSTTATTATTTSTTTAAATTAAPQLSWLQQPPEQPPVSAERPQHSHTAAAMHSLTSPPRVNFVRSQPSAAPSPHFVFHRVFVNETFDSHTRQPYRRPVLALTAVGKNLSKAEKGNSSHVTNNTDTERSHDPGELTDKYYSLADDSVALEYSSEGRKGKDTTQEANEEHGGGEESQSDLSSTHHHHHHHHHHHFHHHHRLHTFKSQLKFLQRWEERLRRRGSHFRLQENTEDL